MTVSPAEVQRLRERLLALESEIRGQEGVERSLLDSRVRWQTVAINAASTMVVVDREGMIEYVHSDEPSLAPEKTVGDRILDHVRSESQGVLRQSLERALESGVQQTVVLQFAESSSWWACRVIPMRRGAGWDAAAVACHDITEQRRSQARLLQTENRLRVLVEQMPAILWSTDLELRLTLLRGAGLRALKLDPNQALGRPLLDLLGMHDKTMPAIEAINAALSGESTKFVQPWRDRVYDAYVEPLRDGSGCIAGILGVALDVTERHQSELEVRAARDELEQRVHERTEELRRLNAQLACDLQARDRLARELRESAALLRKLLDWNERDRQLIAYEIHDGIVQDLTGARMFLDAAIHEIATREPDAAQPLQTCGQLIRESIDESRRLINGLRPPVLEEQGLAEAIRNLTVEMTAKYGLEIDLRIDVRFGRLAPVLETALYRLVQEGLNNVWQHAHTHACRVELIQVDDHVRVEIADQGVGFEPEKLGRKRYGLWGIRERARLLEGAAEITSAPGQGCTIRVVLPLQDARIPDLPGTIVQS